MSGRARSWIDLWESSKVMETTPFGKTETVSGISSTAWSRYVTGPPASSYTANDMSVKPVFVDGLPSAPMEYVPAAALTSAHWRWTVTHSPDWT